MNLVGKILTVLILVMSLVFMTVAVIVYQTHINWRDVVMREQATPGQPRGLKFQLADATTEKANLQALIEKLQGELNTEKTAKREQVAELTTKMDELTIERDKREKDIQDLNKNTAEAVAAMKTTQGTLNGLQTEVETLRKNIQTAQQNRDDSFKKAVALADESYQLENELTRLQSRLADLTADRNRMRDLLRAYDVNPADDPAGKLPKVEGKVTALAQGGSIEVSIGADDGLRKGSHLEVYRTGNGQSTYLGRIEVIQTEPDKAVCKIMPEYRKGAMQPNDRVASKLD
jgi:hypothetical protein